MSKINLVVLTRLRPTTTNKKIHIPIRATDPSDVFTRANEFTTIIPALALLIGHSFMNT